MPLYEFERDDGQKKSRYIRRFCCRVASRIATEGTEILVRPFRSIFRILSFESPLLMGITCLSLLLFPLTAIPFSERTSESIPFKPQVVPRFESLLTHSGEDLLPPDLRKSDYHEVIGSARAAGWWFRYTVNSPFGVFDALGEDMLRIRVHEAQALAKMEKDMSRSVAFGSKILNTVMSPFKFLWKLITEPVETLTGVPKGIKRVGTRIGEMVTGGRGKPEEQGLAGYAGVKRTVAATAGVNVYSSNAVLQEHLDSIAVAGYSEEVGSRIGLVSVSGPLGFASKTASFSDAINEMLVEYEPEDLQQINRKILEGIGVQKDVREGFLIQPGYSPKHATILVHALDEMKGVSNRSLVLQVAMMAELEEEALFMQRLVEMFASYHQTVVPLEEFILVKGRWLVGYTTDRAMIVALPLPHVLWTKELADAADAVVSWQSQNPTIRRVELWASGHLSQQVNRELERRGVIVFEKKRDRLLPSLIPKSLPIIHKVEGSIHTGQEQESKIKHGEK